MVQLSRDCFVCLSKSTNKICKTCKCYAHFKCWGEYLQNTTCVVTTVYDDSVEIYTPYNSKCPQCRSNIKNVKPTTRSDTDYPRMCLFIMTYKNLLILISETKSKTKKFILYKKLFDSIIDNSKLVKNDFLFKENISQNLRSLYEDGWKPANLYHRVIFGKQIT